jgi:alanine racemase
MNHLLRAEVSAEAIRHNIRALRGMLGPRVRFCAVVKSNAYGHGIDLLWPVIAAESDALTVASDDEAMELRNLGYTGPLLMLFCARSCGVDAAAIDRLAELLRHDVVLTATDPADVELIKLAAMAASVEAAVHVEIDSGMTRSGIDPEHLKPLLETIRETDQIRLEGLYTHFAAADEEASSFTGQQLELFRTSITASGIDSNVCCHCANSSAGVDFSETQMDMVRVGLMLYGCRPAPHLAPQLALKPALRVLSRIMQIHEVECGTRVGYGLTYCCERASRIGLVAGGYGDGYLRALSNRGMVRVGDEAAPVVGRVSMDQITVDLTDLPGAMVGDVVELVSNDPSAPNSAENLAAAAGTISYEIMTRMDSHRMQRVVIDV